MEGAGSRSGRYLELLNGDRSLEQRLVVLMGARLGLALVSLGIALALDSTTVGLEPADRRGLFATVAVAFLATALTGAISGYFSTTTSLNGPPVVLLLGRARLPPLSFIADLAGSRR